MQPVTEQWQFFDKYIDSCLQITSTGYNLRVTWSVIMEFSKDSSIIKSRRSSKNQKWWPKFAYRMRRHHLVFSLAHGVAVMWPAETGKKNTVIMNTFHEKHEWNYHLQQWLRPECPGQGLSKPIPDQVSSCEPLIPTCFQSLTGYREWSQLLIHKALSETIHSPSINHFKALGNPWS